MIAQQTTNQIPEIIVSQQAINQTVLTAPTSGATSASALPPSEEVRRMQPSQHRSYDEYDSDDELRREDISFPFDGGNLTESPIT